MYSAYKFNKQGDSIQPWRTPFLVCRQCKRPGFDPWVRQIPWRRTWQSLIVHSRIGTLHCALEHKNAFPLASSPPAIYCTHVSVWNLEKWYCWSYLQGRNRHRCRQWTWGPAGKERVAWIERLALACTHWRVWNTQTVNAGEGLLEKKSTVTWVRRLVRRCCTYRAFIPALDEDHEWPSLYLLMAASMFHCVYVPLLCLFIYWRTPRVLPCPGCCI